MPHQDRTLHFNDPAGTPVELVATMKTVPRMHTRIDTHRGAGALRMDHYQVLVPDVLTTAKFYMDLGFRISDYLYVEAAQRVVGTFLHRKDNPWDIVLLTRSGPRFHHGGYVVEAFEDIVRACDVAGNLGFADRIEHGPGRHGHQHSYYLYVRDPGRPPHRTAAARHPDHRHRRRADDVPGQAERELATCGACRRRKAGSRRPRISPASR